MNEVWCQSWDAFVKHRSSWMVAFVSNETGIWKLKDIRTNMLQIITLSFWSNSLPFDTLNINKVRAESTKNKWLKISKCWLLLRQCQSDHCTSRQLFWVYFNKKAKSTPSSIYVDLLWSRGNTAPALHRYSSRKMKINQVGCRRVNVGSQCVNADRRSWLEWTKRMNEGGKRWQEVEGGWLPFVFLWARHIPPESWRGSVVACKWFLSLEQRKLWEIKHICAGVTNDRKEPRGQKRSLC